MFFVSFQVISDYFNNAQKCWSVLEIRKKLSFYVNAHKLCLESLDLFLEVLQRILQQYNHIFYSYNSHSSNFQTQNVW